MGEIGVKRYRPVEHAWCGGEMTGSVVEDEDGDYVRHDDHVAALAERDALLAEARSIVSTGARLEWWEPREADDWHERRRAWLAKLEGVTRGE